MEFVRADTGTTHFFSVGSVLLNWFVHGEMNVSFFKTKEWGYCQKFLERNLQKQGCKDCIELKSAQKNFLNWKSRECYWSAIWIACRGKVFVWRIVVQRLTSLKLKAESLGIIWHKWCCMMVNCPEQKVLCQKSFTSNSMKLHTRSWFFARN